MIISAKHQYVVFAFFMSFIMSAIMSFVISLINLGWVDNIISIWFQAWVMAFIVAFPVILIVGPFVRKLVSWVVKQP
ncbi:DUF2798 domain-containing protein [Thiomicrospira sp.]|uniref:DUF2798 domain-containing protein n=1 Tax=Thiomicrospira sp. TaxID=935 RepID=UPI0025DFCE07|nr:DUF2798 domain-containing protein [Thiomicrospira sp.]